MVPLLPIFPPSVFTSPFVLNIVLRGGLTASPLPILGLTAGKLPSLCPELLQRNVTSEDLGSLKNHSPALLHGLIEKADQWWDAIVSAPPSSCKRSCRAQAMKPAAPSWGTGYPSPLHARFHHHLAMLIGQLGSYLLARETKPLIHSWRGQRSLLVWSTEVLSAVQKAPAMQSGHSWHIQDLQ